MIVGGHVVVKQAASASQMRRFESELLAAGVNSVVLNDLSGEWINRTHDLKSPKDVVLDMDSSVSPTYGVKKARPTTVTSAAPAITYCSCSTIWATWSGAVCVPAMSKVLTVGEMSWSRWSHATRNRRFGSTFAVTRHLPRWTSTNTWKPRAFSTRSACPPTRVSRRTSPTCSVVQSVVRQSMSRSSMLVLAISRIVGQGMPGGGQGRRASRRPVFPCWLHRHQAEPSLRAGRPLLQSGGTAEQWIKEGKNAIKCTRPPCQRFRNNEVRLKLQPLTNNPGNFLRTLAFPKEIGHWPLPTVQEKLGTIGANIVAHGRYVASQMAEVAVPRDLFKKILRLIDRLGRST